MTGQLDETELHQLVKEAQKGNRRAMDRVIAAMTPLVDSCVRQWRRHADPEDLQQEGFIATAAAARKWDSTLGPFKPFARQHIRGAVSRRAAYDVSLIRLSSEEHRAFLGGTPTERETLNARLSNERSLQGTVASDSKKTYAEVLAGSGATPEELLGRLQEQHQAKTILTDLVSRLPETERKVIRARYLSDEPMKLADLGRELQCHREQARQAELRGLKLLAEMAGRQMTGAAMAKLLRGNEHIRKRKALQRIFGFWDSCMSGSGRCRFCVRKAMEGRAVCETHQWRKKSCPVCKGPVPYRDDSGRQLTYWPPECKSGKATAQKAKPEPKATQAKPVVIQHALIPRVTPCPARRALRLRKPKPHKQRRSA